MARMACLNKQVDERELIKMVKKIVLDAGHALGLAGNKTPDGMDEWVLNHQVALAVAKQLADYEVEVYRVDDTTGKQDIDLQERVSRASRLEPDAFVSIHHNAYTGKWGAHGGVEVYYNLNRKNEIEKALANEISAGIAENTGLKNRGAKTATYTALTVDPKIIALLTEGGFMDSVFDHPVITSIKGQAGYAKAITDVLIKQLKLTKKVKKVKQDVQKGASAPKETLAQTMIKIGHTYTLRNNMPGYETAADAKALKNQRVTVLADQYTIYQFEDGMVNVAKMKGKPGSWINPDQVK